MMTPGHFNKQAVGETTAQEEPPRATVPFADVLAAQDFDWSQSANVISVTPSRRETKGVTGLKPDENGYKKEDSPYGDAFSTVMHRVFELLVLHRALMNNLGEQKVIDACIRRAVAEYTNATYDPGCMGDATADGAKAFKAWLEQTVVLYFWMEKLRPTL